MLKVKISPRFCCTVKGDHNFLFDFCLKYSMASIIWTPLIPRNIHRYAIFPDQQTRIVTASMLVKELNESKELQ